MKKAALLLALLLIFSVAAAGVLAVQICDARDQVEITQTTLYGDPAAADGLHLELCDAWNSVLYWNTGLTLPEAPRTVYTYDRHHQEPEPIQNPQIHIDTQILPRSDSSYGLGKAVQEMLADAEPWEPLLRTVVLRDYLHYYPLQFHMSFDDCIFNYWKNDNWSAEDMDAKAFFNQQMQKQFRIPIPEDMTYDLYLIKDDQGQVAALYSNDGGYSRVNTSFDVPVLTATDTINTQVTPVRVGNRFYFVLPAHTDDGTPLDLSLLPQGYGIFSIPVEYAKDASDGTPLYVPAPKQLEMVYALDPALSYGPIQASSDGSQLLLHGEGPDCYRIMVIDLETMTLLQTLELPHSEDYTGTYLMNWSDPLVLRQHGKSTSIHVISRQPDGTYEVDFTCPLALDQLEPTYLQNAWYGLFAYDGQRLALVTPLSSFDLKTEPGSSHSRTFLVSVFTREGLQYCGRYDSSLDTGRERDWPYAVTVGDWNPTPSWS